MSSERLARVDCTLSNNEFNFEKWSGIARKPLSGKAQRPLRENGEEREAIFTLRDGDKMGEESGGNHRR
ncbi:hypothetical protein ACS0ZG_02210 [Burkholderia gladioli]|uniref:hypothetical protein n=1 Tax=Burkholderia gladioli TaxID=28095 RepID=UPI000AE06CEE|nr:hypothetical protein [Burkholderia gladioli]MDA0571052.1 hypothetical protein [Burkholderia gladioli]MDA0599038.1 hypothetical protein [Burkholderia gladioli]